MNVLLFAPAIFLAYVATGGWIRAIKQVSLCALVQLIIGFPFLATFPVEYLKGSFDIGRVFLFKWTVNWRFVPEEIFIHKSFHVTLLLLHVMALLFFSRKWWAMLQLYSRHGAVGKHIYCIVFKLKLHCLVIFTPAWLHNLLYYILCFRELTNTLVHEQFHRNDVCQILTLPVLYLVLSSTSFTAILY